nr:MAG TPA: hypothetical protein [Bacteriophage sp.]
MPLVAGRSSLDIHYHVVPLLLLQLRHHSLFSIEFIPP